MGRLPTVAVALTIGCTTPSVFDDLPERTSELTDATETCNGIDDDGDGFVDEDEASLCDDGDPCTVGRCDPETGCVQELAPDTCRIDGTCVPSGTASPDDVCAVCDPLFSTTDWSPGGADVSCDDGEACTVNDRCDGAGGCRGDGDVPAMDEQEPSSFALPHDTLRTVNDDGDFVFLLDGSFHEPDDVDSYFFVLEDTGQFPLICQVNSKQPQATALATGPAVAQVCVQVACVEGTLSSIECVRGAQLGDDTCCDPDRATLRPNCSGVDDTVDVFVDVVGTGDTCGEYQLRMGNADSGCTF